MLKSVVMAVNFKLNRTNKLKNIAKFAIIILPKNKLDIFKLQISLTEKWFSVAHTT